MIFTELIEFQQFGWNKATVGAIAVLFFTIAEAFGLLKQNKAIWEYKSGESIANTLFIYFSFMFAIFVVYGSKRKEGAVIVNGLLFIFFIPILCGLHKFKGFSAADKLLMLVGVISLGAMLFLRIKELIFVIYSLGGIIALAAQPWEIWKKKSSGVVEIKLLIIYFVSTLFWIVYSSSAKDYPLMLIAVLSILILSATIILWFYFRRKKRISISSE